MTDATGADAPHGDTIRVVRGNPTAEELAAAVAVVRGYAAAATTGPPDPTEAAGAGAWARRAHGVRRPLPAPGPDAWRTAFWPR